MISDSNISSSLQKYWFSRVKSFPRLFFKCQFSLNQNKIPWISVSLTLNIFSPDHFLTCVNPDRVLGSINMRKSYINTFFTFQASAHNPGDNQCRSTHPGKTNHLSNWRRFTIVNCVNSLISQLYFVEKTLQQDMSDFLQGARGQDFHDITLIVDGEPIGAHKVRFVRILVWELIVWETGGN